MHELPVIKPSTVGNDKLGDGVLTESRPTGPTCPDSCPLKATETRLAANRAGAGVPLCYSHDIFSRYRSVAKGMVDRFHAWQGNRAGWRAKRLVEWWKATARGKPVRFNVHGDILRWGTETVDRDWLADIISTARKVPGFRGWIYTHAWRTLGASTRRAMVRVGIIPWASVHSPQEAREAAAMGYRVAYISPEARHGYNGPRYREDIGAGRPAILCPEQIGTKPDCLSCGFCFSRPTGPDLVFLTH